jgi:hypothetical protein
LDGSSETRIAASNLVGDSAPIYDGLPDSRVVGRHALFPHTTHDDVARINFLAQLNRHLATQVAPFVKTAWDHRASAAWTARTGSPAESRHDVRKALLDDPMFSTWSALRRMTMEQRQQAGRWIALREAETLAAKAQALTAGSGALSIDPALPIPRYVSAVDHHCMAGERSWTGCGASGRTSVPGASWISGRRSATTPCRSRRRFPTPRWWPWTSGSRCCATVLRGPRR